MKYEDRVYGDVEIDESIILELIDSYELQRLKNIDQAGYRKLWAKLDVEIGEFDNSRFAHSVGVYLLLRKFGAPIEEQIAGLIHDVSHTAFSHCIDYVLNVGSEHKQDHQDNTFENFVKNSNIPKILKKYAFDVDYILDDKNFPLKENDLPDICADRIDYSLRTAVIFEEIDFEGAQKILDNLSVKDSVWFFEDFEIAKEYAELFKKVNDVHYVGLDSARMYEAVKDFVGYSLDKGYIQKEDLYLDDKKVIDLICKKLDSDMTLQVLWGRMNDKSKIIEGDKDDYDETVNCKSRMIDPLFLSKNGPSRVSEFDNKWGSIVEEGLKPKKYFLKFFKNFSAYYKKWQEERKKMDRVVDKLGCSIDENIKDAVTAFIVNDVPTTSSCGGHVDIENGKISCRSPYITLGFNNVGDDYIDQIKIIEKIKEEVGISEENIWNEEFCQRFYDYVENSQNKVEKTPEFEEIIRKNSEIEKRVSAFLDNFYKYREVESNQKLEIEILWGDGGVNLSFKNKPKNEEELKVQQKEIQTFGEFLKEKFFNS